MGRPLWVQAVDSLPSGSQGRGLGSPGVGLWGRGGEGGRIRGAHQKIPSRRPGGHSSHITERPSPVSVCVCVKCACLCQAPQAQGGRLGGGGGGEEKQRDAAHLLGRDSRSSFSTHTTQTRPAIEAADAAGAEESQGDIPGRKRTEENTLVEDHLQHFCPGLNQPRM